MKRTLIAGIAISICLAVSASATTVVLGESRGASCYQAAKHGRTGYDDVKVCTQALTEDALSHNQRAATYVNRGILYSIRGEYTHAFSDFDGALALNPRLGEAFANRGGTLIRMGQYERAVPELDKALRYQLDEPARVYFNRAIAYEEMKDMPSAYRDYRKAAELLPGWDMPKMELTRFRVDGK